MKHFIFSIITVTFFQACKNNRPPVANPKPPNFLVLIADDLGWTDLGCQGNPYISTPNIDRIAEEGLQFENAFLTIAQCSPSRISILSGKYPHATGAEDLHVPMPDTLKIIPHYLKEKNYFSGILKKSHLGEYGEDKFNFIHEDLSEFTTFLTATGELPFFCWVGFTDPHRPYRSGIIDTPQNPDRVLVPPYLVDDDSTRIDLADYYNEIRRMDARVGEYFRILEEQNKLENTYIIFLSDNGAPFPRAKGTVHDAGIKTPLLVKGPNIPPGRKTKYLHSVIDLAPTILEMVGIEKPNQMQGESILWEIKGEPGMSRKYIFSERNWHNTDEHIRSVRSKQFKLIENNYLELPSGVASDIGGSYSWRSLLRNKKEGELTKAQSLIFQVPRPKYELYNLVDDPEEFSNLSEAIEYQAVKKELISALEKWKKETDDFPPTERRRPDNVNRETGIKFWPVKVPGFIEE